MLVFTYINNIESCIDIKLLLGLCKACMFLETVGLCFWVEMTLLSKSFDMATGKACLWRSCERLRFLFYFLRILKHGNAIILIKNERKPPGSQQFKIECQNQDGGASVLTLVSCASALLQTQLTRTGSLSICVATQQVLCPRISSWRLQPQS